MQTAIRHVFLITCVGVVVLFTNLGGPRLWDRDEPRNAGCTVEMLARSDWITPVFDGELRTHKPILLYWLMMTAYAVFGVSEFSARFWSAVAAIGTVLMTYGIGRRLFSPRVGLWAAVVLLTTLMFDVAARAATPDSLLIFWGTAALFVYVWGTFPGESSSTGQQDLPIPMRDFPRWPVAVVMYACMGVAVLAKGPVGLVLPTGVIGMYLLVLTLPPPRTQRADSRWSRFRQVMTFLVRPFAPRHFLRTCWRMRPLTAISTVAIVALPWYVAVAYRTDGEWVRGFLMDHNLGRAAQSLEGHSGSILYYPLALLVGFFPWSVFAVPTVLEIRHGWKYQRHQRASYLLAVCWIGVYLGLFTIARTKLPSYITPCYPAVALLTAVWMVAWAKESHHAPGYWGHAALWCLGIVGLIVLVAVPLVAVRYLPGEQWLAALGLIPMATALGGLLFLRRGQPRVATWSLALGAVLLTTSLFAVGAAQVARHQTFDVLVHAVHDRSGAPRIGTLGVAEPSWVFYTRRQLDHLFAPELVPGVPADRVMLGEPRSCDWQVRPSYNAWHYLSMGPDRFVISSARYLAQIGPLPAHVVEIARTPYFLRDDELVLLGSRPTTPLTADRPERGQPRKVSR